MQSMNVPDQAFAKLLARWCIQSEEQFGQSGGKSSSYGDKDADNKLPVASMRPYRSKDLFNSFTRGWEKQPGFETAKPLLAWVSTALASKYGDAWKLFDEPMRNWYRVGLMDAEWLLPAAKALLALQQPLLIYGRDGLPLYRMLAGVKHVYYAEGVSRHLITEPDRPKLAQYLAAIVSGISPTAMMVHVDTGFAGSVPTAGLASLGLKATPNNIRMLSSSRAEWSMGYDRDRVCRLEYRPKLFFRPTGWRETSPEEYEHVPGLPQFIPDMRITGDAPNVSAYLIGVMVGSSGFRATIPRKQMDALWEQQALSYQGQWSERPRAKQPVSANNGFRVTGRKALRQKRVKGSLSQKTVVAGSVSSLYPFGKYTVTSKD